MLLRKGEAEQKEMKKSVRSIKSFLAGYSCPWLPALLSLMLGILSIAPPMSFAWEREEGPASSALQKCFFARFGCDLAALCRLRELLSPWPWHLQPLLGWGFEVGNMFFQIFPGQIARQDLTVHSLAGYWFCKYFMGLFIVTNIT